MGKQRAREAWWAVGPRAAGIPGAQVMTHSLVAPERVRSPSTEQPKPRAENRIAVFTY